MTDFNYEKAYCVQAVPAFNNLNNNQKKAHAELCELVKDLNQNRLLNIPVSDEMTACMASLTCKELAEIANTSYFTGHWQPGLLPVLFENSKGQSWKVSNVIDQELRKRLKTPHNIQIHEGKFRVTFSNKNCWLWEEFSLATEYNLDIFKNCNLPFGENTLHNSAHKLAAICNDLWSDVNAMPDNDLYNEFKALKKAKLKRDLIKDNEKRIENIKQKIKDNEKEIQAFTWLLDNDLFILDNVIYYSHTGVFCFGWRDPIDADTKSLLLDKLSEFPFDYEFKKGA
jgi:hypothetical protein